MENKFSGFAIAGFVLSCFYFTSILGIIFSAIALSQTKNKEKRGRGLAIAGLIIGSVFLTAQVILLNHNLNVLLS